MGEPSEAGGSPAQHTRLVGRRSGLQLPATHPAVALFSIERRREQWRPAENYRLGVQVSRRDLSDLLRSVGGLLFAAGAVVLLARKSAHHGWSDFARLLVVLVPTIVLYRLALAAPREERARPWQSVLMVT